MTEQVGPAALPDMRKNIIQALEAGETALARGLLAELWFSHPGPATAPFILSGLEKLARAEDAPEETRLNIAILRSAALEPVIPILKAAALLHHIRAEVSLGAFNAYAQELLSPDGPAYAPETDVVVLAVQTRDIAPRLWHGGKGSDEADAEQVISHFETLIETFRSRSDAYLLIHNLEQPSRTGDGILDGPSRRSQRRAINRINEALAEAAARYDGVHVLDYDALVARHGRAAWGDESRWLTMRLPMGMEHLHHMADEWLRYFVPMSGRVAKALIVDLDNTLWGGVLGEDGEDGLALDGEYPGGAYQAVQRALLDLSRRGIILGICSKNDEADALGVLEQHPGMLVRPKNFAAFRINWRDKAQNLREIARELNIGADAIAFLDDNPVERLWVRQSLPEVTVIELTDDPMSFADTLRASPVFERLGLSQEDGERNRHYAEQRQRSDLKASVSSLEDFYRSLDMRLDVFVPGPADIPRIAQLTQKTNQFNLTTRRYSEADISRLMDDSAFLVYGARVTDRFGDSGIISVAIVEIQEQHARLDTFLMSCRVIGRTVETGILSVIAARLEERGVRRLAGEFIPTAKNTPVRDFLPEHGFSGGEIVLPAPTLRVPEWIGL